MKKAIYLLVVVQSIGCIDLPSRELSADEQIVISYPGLQKLKGIVSVKSCGSFILWINDPSGSSKEHDALYLTKYDYSNKSIVLTKRVFSDRPVYDADIIANDDGTITVCGSDTNRAGSIYCQRFDDKLSKIWKTDYITIDEIGVLGLLGNTSCFNISPPGRQVRVIKSDSNSVIVLWKYLRLIIWTPGVCGYSNDVFAHKVDKNGKRLWPEPILYASRSDNAGPFDLGRDNEITNIRAVNDKFGNVIISYPFNSENFFYEKVVGIAVAKKNRDGGYSSEFYKDAATVNLTLEKGVALVENHLLADDGSRGAVVAWMESDGGSNYEADIAWLKAGDDKEVEVIPIMLASFQADNNALKSLLVYEKDGNKFALVLINDNISLKLYQVKLKLENGVLKTPQIMTVATRISNNSKYSSANLTVDEKGNLYVSWVSGGDRYSEIWTTAFNSSGTRIFPEARVSTRASFKEALTTITVKGSGAIVGWEDTTKDNIYAPNSPPDYENIYLETISAGGVLGKMTCGN